MIHEIIVLEGLDRIGKGTAFSKLEKQFIDKGFKVKSIFRSSLDEKSNEISKNGYHHIESARLEFDNHLKYDLFSLGALEMLNRILVEIQLSNEDCVVFIDRLGLSNLVYGKILRTEEFRNTFSIANRSLSKLRNYITGVFKSLESFALVSIIVAHRPDNYQQYVDDTENPHIKIDKHRFEVLNIEYQIEYEIFKKKLYEHQAYRIKYNKVIVDSTNPNDLYEQIIKKKLIYTDLS